jgi:hypothetical protein
MNFGFGQTIQEVAASCGASTQSVWRWIEEAREGLKEGINGWIGEALIEMVAFALLVEGKSPTQEEVERELVVHIDWLRTLLQEREATMNWSALGWTRSDRQPTVEEGERLVREKIDSIVTSLGTSAVRAAKAREDRR